VTLAETIRQWFNKAPDSEPAALSHPDPQGPVVEWCARCGSTDIALGNSHHTCRTCGHWMRVLAENYHPQASRTNYAGSGNGVRSGFGPGGSVVIFETDAQGNRIASRPATRKDQSIKPMTVGVIR